MIIRTFDATVFNKIVNDPSIRPFVADEEDGVLDLTSTIADTRNICLIGEYGAFLCLKYYDGCYEVHTQILPQGRGAWAFAFAEAGSQYMFTATDCVELVTRVPERHLGAGQLAKSAGFRPMMITPPECLWNGRKQTCFIMSLTIQDWGARPLLRLADRGTAFHEWLNEQVSIGIPHADDYEHNKVVGACLEMIDAGHPIKAVVWYNRHAYSFRHTPIKLLSVDPIRVQFDAGVLTKVDGQIQFEPSTQP